jgi:hypothetical protein
MSNASDSGDFVCGSDVRVGVTSNHRRIVSLQYNPPHPIPQRERGHPPFESFERDTCRFGRFFLTPRLNERLRRMRTPPQTRQSRGGWQHTQDESFPSP